MANKQKKTFKEIQKEQKKRTDFLQNIPTWKWWVLGTIYFVAIICAWQAFLPLKAEWHYREGFNYDAMGNPEMAVQRLQLAVKAQPLETQYEVNLGKAYEDLARKEQAIEGKIKYLKLAEKHYGNIINISPLNPWYQNRIGEIYRIYSETLPNEVDRKKYYDLYEKKLMMAQALDKNNALFNMSLAYLYHRTGRFEKAKELYLKVLEIDFAFSEAYFNLADIYRREGDVAKTKEVYQKLTESMNRRIGGPNFNNAYLNLGRIYFEEGNIPSAAAAYEKEFELQPNSDIVMRNLAAVYQQQGRWYDLIKIYHKLLIVNPNAADIRRYLGYAYYKVGKLDEAVSELEAALRIDPSNQEAQRNYQLIRSMKNSRR